MQILRWLWSAWRGNRLQAVLNALIGVLMVAVSLAQVWAVKRAIDVAAGSAGGSLLWAVAVMGLLILTDFGLNISSVWVRNILGIRAQNRMQQRMLDRLLRAEWAGRERRHSGDVINRLETDVNNVVTFLTETLPNTLGVLLLFIGAFSYLFSMDRLLAFVTVAILPLFIGVSKLYVRRMRSLTRMVRNSDSQVQSVLQEAIQHRLLIKTLEDDDAMVGKLAHTQQQLRYHVLQRTRFSVLSNFILNFGFSFSYLVAFLWAAVRMSQHTLTFGGMTAFLQLVNRIQTPARSLSKVIPAFVNVFTAAERLMELEEAPLEEQGEPIAFDAPCGVRFTDVTYAYEADAPVIDRLTFDFRPGTCTAILGETGAGKTTLIRLILALIRPQQGQVELYDNRHALPLSPRMRCNFVYVPQGNTLMSGTIRDNLLMGSYRVKDKALVQQRLEQMYEIFPRIQERSNQLAGTLSGGEQQMVAIARGMMCGPKLLMLDEPSLGLMPKLVEEVFSFVQRINKLGTTIVIVEQNVNETLKFADYAYIVSEGEIALHGTPQELLKDDEIRRIYLGHS